MSSDDDFTDIITDVIAGYPGPAAGPPQPSPEQPHRVLWFAVGAILWLLVAILGYVLMWFLLHG